MALAMALVASAGCASKQAVTALPNESADEMKVLMQDCRDTYDAAGKYLAVHKGFPDQDKVKESLSPLLEAGSKANLARFIQVFGGGKGAYSTYMDGNPMPFPEYGHYKGETGTATIMLNGDVKWTAR